VIKEGNVDLVASCSDQESLQCLQQKVVAISNQYIHKQRESSDRQNVLNQCFQRTSQDAFYKSRIVETAATKDDYKVLEIGCGAGFTTTDLADWLPNAQITAIDTNSDMIASAQEDRHELLTERVHIFVKSGEQAAE
jgi:ubiquinone/menaquinone biosynthesis C-methylase UbiE